jgi:hypothetical protein
MYVIYFCIYDVCELFSLFTSNSKVKNREKNINSYNKNFNIEIYLQTNISLYLI